MDRYSNGGGLPDNVEFLFIEINIRNKKWLLCCSYNLHKNNMSNHTSQLSKGLDNYISNYDILYLGDLNITSISNKFQFLASQIINNVDVLLVSETKLDDFYPTVQFLLDGFSKPYRLDRCSNGGGLPDNVEFLFIEINIRNKKWLLCCSYNLHKNNMSNHTSQLSKGLDNYISNYDILYLGNLNSQPSENCVTDFCNVYNLSNLVKEPSCYKNPDNPSCMDLFLKNRPKCFQSVMTMETGISDFHIMVITVLKIFYKKEKPKIIHYRNHKTFSANLFKEELNNELLSIDNNNAELAEFTNTVLSIPCTQKKKIYPCKQFCVHDKRSQSSNNTKV